MIFKFLFILTLYRECLTALPTQSSCGVPATSPSISGATLNRIINGEIATANSWPWQVSLRKIINTKYYSSHFCGGVLIYEDIVVTAAHCVNDMVASEIGVVVGINDISTEPASTSNTITVSFRIYHESFAIYPEVIHDIAILKLSKSVVLGSKIALACLPSASDLDTILTKNIVVTGWGSTTGKNYYTELAAGLKQAKLLVNPGKGECIYHFSSNTYCVYDDTNTASNACFGDSGGPLVYYVDSKWYVYGIASFLLVYTDGTCYSSKPSYYSQVPAYLTWIEDALNKTLYMKSQQSNFGLKMKFYFKIEFCLLFALIAYFS